MLGHWSITRLACAGAILALVPLALVAQDDPPPVGDDAAAVHNDDAQPSVRQVGPTILYYKDKDGRLRPAPNLTWEEFAKAMSQRADQPASGPSFSFTDNNKLSGSVADGQATLDIEYEVELLRSGLVEVPLNLAGTPIVEFHLTGPGKHFLRYDEASGYAALIRADEADSRHKIQLKVRAPISTTETDNRLSLNLPRVVAAKLDLRVPTAQAMAKVSAGAEILETRHEGDSTTFSVAQPGGKFTLNWAGPGTAAAKPQATFDAIGTTLVRWKSPTQITWDATFSINVLTDEMSQVQVQIPPGCRLPTQEWPGQRVAAVEEVAVENTGGEKTTVPQVTIEFDRPVSKSLDVHLLCERYLEPRALSDEQRVEVGRFQVVGAARQSGVLGIVTPDDWKAQVKYGVSWIQPLELPPGFREAGVLGSNTYRYVAPDTLTMRVTARQTRVVVAPQHVLRVAQDRLHLESRLAYRVIGARLDACRGDWPGWSVERVELVEKGEGRTIGIEPNQTEPLEINLPQAMRGDFELRILASQPIARETGEFVVVIPRIFADESLPATVIVQPEDNVDLAILANAKSGLATIEAAVPLELPARQQPPIVLRDEGAPVAQLAGLVKPRAREVTASSATEIFVARSSCKLTQEFEFQVLYEPLSALLLEAPPEFGEMNVLEILVNDQPPLRVVPDDDGLLQIELSQPLKDKIVVRIAAQKNFTALAPDVASAVEIPTLRPAAELTTRANTAAQISAAADIHLDAEDTAWTPTDAPSDGALTAGLRLATNALPSTVRLSATYRPQQRAISTVVEKAWLQTWLSGGRRSDRAVYQLRTNSDRVRLALPPEINEQQLVVLVDGVDVVAHFDLERRMDLALPIPNATDTRSPGEVHRHVIECWWPNVAGDVNVSSIRLKPPQVVDAWTMQTYWHVIVPRRRLSLLPPAGMEAQMDASPWWWQRRPRMSQEDLERWSGATSQASPDSQQPAAYAQYLYSTVGPPPATSLSTSSAATTMLAFALVVLGAGMLLYYLPALRHPAILGAAAVAVSCLALVWPAAALFVAQAALLAVAVVLSSLALEQVFKQRWSLWRKYSSLRMPASATTRRQRTTRADSVLAASPSTTATAAAALPASGHESP